MAITISNTTQKWIDQKVSQDHHLLERRASREPQKRAKEIEIHIAIRDAVKVWYFSVLDHNSYRQHYCKYLRISVADNNYPQIADEADEIGHAPLCKLTDTNQTAIEMTSMEPETVGGLLHNHRTTSTGTFLGRTRVCNDPSP